MMWGEGLSVKLGKLGFKGRMYKWIKEFYLGG